MIGLRAYEYQHIGIIIIEALTRHLLVLITKGLIDLLQSVYGPRHGYFGQWRCHRIGTHFRTDLPPVYDASVIYDLIIRFLPIVSRAQIDGMRLLGRYAALEENVYV